MLDAVMFVGSGRMECSLTLVDAVMFVSLGWVSWGGVEEILPVQSESQRAGGVAPA